MLDLSLIEVGINNNETLVHQMSKALGFESDHESFLVFNPLVAFPKDREIACTWLGHLVPVGKTFVLGQNHTTWHNFLHRIVLGVAEVLELVGGAEQDIDTSTILV